VATAGFALSLRKQGVSLRRSAAITYLFFYGAFLTVMLFMHNFVIIGLRIFEPSSKGYSTYDFYLYSLILLGAVLFLQGIQSLRAAFMFKSGNDESAVRQAQRASWTVLAIAVPLIPLQFFGIILTVLSLLNLAAMKIILSKRPFTAEAVAFALIIVFSLGNLPVLAQTTRSASAKQASPQIAANGPQYAAKKCDGGWSGTITYTKTQNQNEHNKTPTGYISSTSSFQATAEITVREDGSASASAKVKVSGKIEDVKEGSECCMISLAGCSRKGGFKLADIITTESTAQATAVAKSRVSITGETLIANIGVPEAIGKTVRTVQMIRKKECDSVNQDVTKTQESAVSYLVGPINISASVDPKNPNVIRGTQRDGDTEISYSFSRCAAPDIKISDLALEEHKYPDAQAWHDAGGETVDGNLVRLKAKVRNDGSAPGYATVKFTETQENIELPGSVSVSLQPGEEREIESEWDTSGFAWSNDGKPKSNRQIKAEIANESLTEDIRILPKPVILVHGLWANAAGWSSYQSYLNEAHSFAWRAFPVGARPEIAKMSTGDRVGNYAPTNSIFQNAQELGKEIKHVREEMNAWHVDIVAHSMGGLISRFYIHSFMQPVFDGKPEVGHLVMLGTPNMGSPCADLMGGVFDFFEQAGRSDASASTVGRRRIQPPNHESQKRQILDSRRHSGAARLPGKRVGGRRGDDSFGVVASYRPPVCAARTHELNRQRRLFAFVKPRLAIGPKGSGQIETAALEETTNGDFAELNNNSVSDRYGFAKYFVKSAYKRLETAQTIEDEVPGLIVRKAVRLAAKQTAEIEIPVSNAAAAGVTFVAAPAVSASLIDANNAIVGTSAAGITATDIFRTIAAEKSIANGIWKLKLENTGDKETIVLVAGWTNSDSSQFALTAGKLNAAGQVGLQAKLLNNNAPVLNAKITARINDTVEIALFDDGQHADGAANDGIYGADFREYSVVAIMRLKLKPK
jgi:pimeloyl-ACP methyl ester carboxylesterase